MKAMPLQVGRIEPGMILFNGAYVRVLSVTPLDTSAVPMVQIKCGHVDGEASPTEAQRVITLRDNEYVTMILGHVAKKAKRLPVLHLVSCVSVKLNQPAPARELYCSQWFKSVRAIVEHEEWRVLSALHGVIHPDKEISPYNETLTTKPRIDRQIWARRVLQQIEPAERYVLWAGAMYAEFLADELRAELPLRGLGIGQQLHYLKSIQRHRLNRRHEHGPY